MAGSSLLFSKRVGLTGGADRTKTTVNEGASVSRSCVRSDSKFVQEGGKIRLLWVLLKETSDSHSAIGLGSSGRSKVVKVG